MFEWLRKHSKRTLEIAAYRQSHPCETMASIGRKFGISRVAVYKAIRRHNIHTGDDIHTGIKKQTYTCNYCGKEYTCVVS